MNAAALCVAALILLSAAGLVIWAWFAMSRLEVQMRSISGFERVHFEIGPQAAETADEARWPITG